ncbi:MAG: hypothetical protein R3344_11910 [Acidobacteriota bacterium]|nr:hypothetical protein [Acidobacteriota bacterium]
MSADSFELLSTFLDGEEVDAGELAEALARPGARETLRDFALLRADVRDDPSRPSPAFYEQMDRIFDRETGRPRRWWSSWVPVPVPALAVLVVVAVALTAWIGLPRVFEQPPAEPQPPQPTRVIHFEQGVDWRAS